MSRFFDTIALAGIFSAGLAIAPWAKIVLSQVDVSDLISAGEIKVRAGSARLAVRLFGCFDQYRPENTLLVEPLAQDGG